MTIYEFMGDHPIVTVLVVWAVCEMVVKVAYAAFKYKPGSSEDDE